MWNLSGDGDGQAVANKTIIKCNAKEFDVTETTGIALVEKLKAIARENQIGKFDIYDSEGKSLSSSDVENGSFTSPLSIVRFNVAA